VFVEYHPFVFLVKDPHTKKVLLRGRCRGGLYPFPSLEQSTIKCVLSMVKPSITRWHERLGHPSMTIVQKVLDNNQLVFSKSSDLFGVCDACQCAKSHQLPFPRFVSVSKAPLELIFSDVWATAPSSVGRNTYYVSFIDDWIFLLKHKSEVFAKFHIFQQHVKRLLNRKILAIQTDLGEEYEKLNSFFTKVSISHLVSCPPTQQQNGAAERKHRHIVDVGLSLFARSSMPLKFWDEAYLMATFLINRTPSQVISYHTPLERLLDQKSDYSFLGTFGSACWPNL
jgi:hypothetical protein